MACRWASPTKRTGSPQDESVRCADLWPVQLEATFHKIRRPTGPWLQRCDVNGNNHRAGCDK